MGYSEIEQIIYKAIATAARAQGIDDETIIITNSSDVGDYTDAYVTIQSAEMEALSDKDLAQVLYRLQTCIDNSSGTNIIILVYFKTIDMKYTYNFQTFGATDEQGLYKILIKYIPYRVKKIPYN